MNNRHLSDCTDVQADLHLCCLYMAKTGFSHDMAHLVCYLYQEPGQSQISGPEQKYRFATFGQNPHACMVNVLQFRIPKKKEHPKLIFSPHQ